MKHFLTINPKLFDRLWPSRLWRMPGTEKVLYLTFDDGPTPGVTDLLLHELAQYEAKATFFMVGQQAQRHPELAREVQAQGHRIGSHSQHHLNGAKTAPLTYLQNVAQGEQTLRRLLGREAPLRLFRPPYGRLTRAQAKGLSDKQVVMWDVLSVDFNQRMKPWMIRDQVKKRAVRGSIVVFHDSEKAGPRMLKALPEILAYFAAAGFRFEALPEEVVPAKRR